MTTTALASALTREARKRVRRFSTMVDAVVQMEGCPTCIPRSSDETQDVARFDDIAGMHIGEPVEMCIVVGFEPRTKNPDDLSAQRIRSHFSHDSARRADNGCDLRGEDVDALVAPAARARRTPGVDQ